MQASSNRAGWVKARFFFQFFFLLVITEAGSKRKSESPQRQMLALDGVGRGVGGMEGWKGFQGSSSISRSCYTFSCASWMFGTPDSACFPGRTVQVGQLDFGATAANSDSSSSN